MSFFNKPELPELDISSPEAFSNSLVAVGDDLDRKLINPGLWEKISRRPNPRAYIEVVESYAESGSVTCQEFVVQWHMMTIESASSNDLKKLLLKKIVKYGELAAKSGVTSEAINLPISMMRLSQILTAESGGTYTDEIEDLFRGAYRWSLANAENPKIPAETREFSAKMARDLYEGSPDLYEIVRS